MKWYWIILIIVASLIVGISIMLIKKERKKKNDKYRAIPPAEKEEGVIPISKKEDILSFRGGMTVYRRGKKYFLESAEGKVEEIDHERYLYYEELSKVA